MGRYFGSRLPEFQSEKTRNQNFDGQRYRVEITYQIIRDEPIRLLSGTGPRIDHFWRGGYEI